MACAVISRRTPASFTSPGGNISARVLLRTLLDFEHRISDQAVRLAMHRRRRVRGRCIDKAEDLALPFVNPVAQVVHVVLALGLEIRHVRLSHIIGRYSAFDGVDIHVERHCSSCVAATSSCGDGRSAALSQGSGKTPIFAPETTYFSAPAFCACFLRLLSAPTFWRLPFCRAGEAKPCGRRSSAVAGRYIKLRPYRSN